MYKGPKDKDNGVGIISETQGWAGWRKAKGKNWDNCNRINKNKIYQIKKKFLNLKKKAHKKVKSNSHKRQNEDLQNYH